MNWAISKEDIAVSLFWIILSVCGDALNALGEY